MLTKDQEAFSDKLAYEGRLCDVCVYQYLGCGGGVKGGPNGPIYPACTESDYENFIDLAALDELMLEED